MLPRNYWPRGIDRNKGIGLFDPQGVGVGALWNSCMKSTWLVGKKMLVLACLQGRRLPFSPDPWDEAMCCATAMYLHYLHMLLHGWIVCVHKRMFFFEDSACIQFVSCVSSFSATRSQLWAVAVYLPCSPATHWSGDPAWPSLGQGVRGSCSVEGCSSGQNSTADLLFKLLTS